jgi:uncharacterized damage-inducible protein DinB
MKSFYVDLFRYDAWANAKLIESLKRQEINDENVLRLLSHLLTAESVWLKRIKGDIFENAFWDLLNIIECERLSNECAANYASFLNTITESDFEKNMSYKNSREIQYTNSVAAALKHVSFHSAYHRGQIAREVRKLNKEPVNTDYITFIREQA